MHRWCTKYVAITEKHFGKSSLFAVRYIILKAAVVWIISRLPRKMGHRGRMVEFECKAISRKL